jgi:polysaccharide biosynthesis/export protein
MNSRFLNLSRTRMVAAVVLTAVALAADPCGLVGQSQDPPRDPSIFPGDMVRLEVWQEEEMSGEFLVDQHGRVTLPLVGEVDVRAHTELSLRALVREQIQESVYSPAIQLFVLKRIRVLGEVMDPGLFHLDATMSVADALALAGGRTPIAKSGEIVLRRAGERITTDVNMDDLLARLEARTGDELLVPREGWVQRNVGAVITGSLSALGVLVIYLVN